MMHFLQATSLAAVAGRWSRRLGAALLLAAGLSGAAQAQAPANDECVGAIALPVNTTCTNTVVTTVGATSSPATMLNGCGNAFGFFADPDVWYSLVAPPSGGVIVTANRLSGSSVGNVRFDLYSGTCGALVPVACNAGNIVTMPQYLTVRQLTPGNTYYLRASPDNNTGFNLCARSIVLNDDCTRAAPLPVNTSYNPVVVSVIGATPSPTGTPTSSCGLSGFAADVWHTVVVPASGGFSVRTTSAPGGNIDGTDLYVYFGSCGSLILVGCNTGSASSSGARYDFASVTIRNQTPGDVLLVRTVLDQSQGNFALRTEYTTCVLDLPANDEPAAAAILPLNPTCAPVDGYIIGASTTTPNGYANPGTCTAATSTLDVWYSFRTNPSGTGPQTVRLIMTGNGASLVRVFSAPSSAGPFTQVACSAQGSFTPAPPLRMTNLAPNTVYYVSVAGYVSSTPIGAFNICAQDLTVAATRAALAGQPVEVFPNPAQRSATLRLPALGSGRTAQVAVLNALGQVVRTQVVHTATATETALSLAGLPAGLYTVRVQAGAETAVLRLAVE